MERYRNSYTMTHRGYISGNPSEGPKWFPSFHIWNAPMPAVSKIVELQINTVEATPII